MENGINAVIGFAESGIFSSLPFLLTPRGPSRVREKIQMEECLSFDSLSLSFGAARGRQRLLRGRVRF